MKFFSKKLPECKRGAFYEELNLNFRRDVEELE